MSDDASDVTKALAAFGAPTLRYHSFGQAQMRPTGPMNPSRAPAAVDPAVAVTQQSEPVAAPEALPQRGGLFQSPLTAPMRGAVPPASLFPASPAVPPPFPAASTVAPPPRPLAEWAAPVGPMPTAKVVPPMPAPTLRDLPVSDAGMMTPASPPAPPADTPVVHERPRVAAPMPMPAPIPAPHAAVAIPPVPLTTPGPVGGSHFGPHSALADIFEFLAA